jgi:hypothetical protein
MLRGQHGSQSMPTLRPEQRFMDTHCLKQNTWVEFTHSEISKPSPFASLPKPVKHRDGISGSVSKGGLHQPSTAKKRYERPLSSTPNGILMFNSCYKAVERLACSACDFSNPKGRRQCALCGSYLSVGNSRTKANVAWPTPDVTLQLRIDAALRFKKSSTRTKPFCVVKASRSKKERGQRSKWLAVMETQDSHTELKSGLVEKVHKDKFHKKANLTPDQRLAQVISKNFPSNQGWEPRSMIVAKKVATR